MIVLLPLSPLVGLGILYILGLGIYRLYFSPLAAFPGPKLAALTLWYEFYYDVVLRGQYVFHIRDLHEKYGPIIRINPYELHISDPEYYDVLYVNGAKRDKWEWYTKQFGGPDTMFATVAHDLHRKRRGAINRFFSISNVRRLQPMLEEKVDQLIGRFLKARASNTVIPLEYALAAYTNDIVSEYSYGESQNRLSRDDWGSEYLDVVTNAGKFGNLLKQMIFIFHIMNGLPAWLQEKVSPDLGLVLRIHKRKSSTVSNRNHPADSEKSTSRLKDEALIVVGAGTGTTSWALCVAIFHLLSAPEVLSKLKKELKENIPQAGTRVPLPQLEKLPYLTAVIQEALRMSNGVATRLQRSSPDTPLFFTDEKSGREWTIPAGTPVSMTGPLLHHDESIFPNSHEFRPERWLENPRLDRYLVAFSKGSRQCLGINLAYAEMYLCLSALFRVFGSRGTDDLGKPTGVLDDGDEGALELYETTDRDVRMVGDGFIPLVEASSKGVRIRIQKP